MYWLRKHREKFINGCGDFIELFKAHPVLSLFGVALTVVCIWWYFDEYDPGSADPPWKEFRKESLFSFGVELLIIWVTVVVVYFVLEGRKKLERDPVYRAVFKDAHVVYQKMFEWVFAIMREEFANAERQARHEYRPFPHIDQNYRSENAECSRDFQFFARKMFGWVLVVMKEELENDQRKSKGECTAFRCIDKKCRTGSAERSGDPWAKEEDGRFFSQKMFGWVFVIMREEFANHECRARSECRAFRCLDEKCRADNAERSTDFSAKKMVVQFFREYENKTICVGRQDFEKRLYDIEKDIEHFLQCHAAFLVSDVSEREGSQLIRHFGDVRLFLRNLQRVLDYGEVELAEEINLTFLKRTDGKDAEKDDAFFVRVERGGRSEEILLSFLKTAIEKGEDDVWDEQLAALHDFHNKVRDKKDVANYFSNSGLKCQSMWALVDSLSQQGGQEGARDSELKRVETDGREWRRSEYPGALKSVHERLAMDVGLPMARYNLGVIIYEYGEARREDEEDKKAVGLFRTLSSGMNLCGKDEVNWDWLRAGACFHLGLMYRDDRCGGTRGPKEAKRWFEKAAEWGHKDAQFVLGLGYLDGRGEEKNPEKARELFEKAGRSESVDEFIGRYREGCTDDYNKVKEFFEKTVKRVALEELNRVYGKARRERERLLVRREWYGTTGVAHVEALYQLGRAYWEGRGSKRDDFTAVKHFQKAAKVHVEAQYLLWLARQEGQGTEQDDDGSLEEFEKSARVLVETEYQLGVAHWEGRGTDRDDDVAVEQFRKVAEDYVEARYLLGLACWEGRGTPRDEGEAVELFEEAAEQGHSGAQYYLWRAYSECRGREWDEAKENDCFRQSSRQGHVETQYHPGRRYFEGQGAERNDDKALKRLEGAAEDHVEAKYLLGLAHWEGRGTRRDEGEAVKLFEEAAKRGHGGAQYYLGLSYWEGRGRERGDYSNLAPKWIRESAKQGHIEAQFHLWRVYSEGRGTDRDEYKAVESLRAAAKQGHGGAQYYLGLTYLEGCGIPKDGESVWLAAKWLHKAAKQGHALAMSCLGNAYRDGYGVAEHIYETVEWFPKDVDEVNADVAKRLLGLAMRGHADAQFVLGLACLKNRGTEQDVGKNEAVRWFREAADQAHAGAEYHLGLVYRDTRGVPDNHDEDAEMWLLEPAEQGNRKVRKCLPHAADQESASEQYEKGLARLKGGDSKQCDDEIVKWFRKAASQGHADARDRLGAMWLEDRSLEQGGAEVVRYALTSLRRRAGSGDLEAANCLGRLYLEGRGVDLDYFEALARFRRTAKQDHADGQFQLGKMYRDGLGVPRDYRQAVVWFRKAAEQGIAAAECALGIAYRDGCGVEKRDPGEAVEWFRRAAEKRHAPAYFELRRMRRKQSGSKAKGQEEEKSVVKLTEMALKEAVECLKLKYGSPSDPEAEFAVGVAYRDGCGVERSPEEGMNCLGLAASRGHAWAFRELAKVHPGDPLERQNRKKSLKKAVDQFKLQFKRSHDAEAAFALGIAYRDGCGVEKKNGAEAENWFRKAAEQENSRVQYELGKMRLEDSDKGQGVAKALQQLRLSAEGGCCDALEVIEKLAEESGNSSAQVILGRVYLESLGVPTEYCTAAYWFRRAAKQGNADGQFLLGQMYGAGCGVEEDAERAKELIREAARHAHVGAYHELARIYRTDIRVKEESPAPVKFSSEWPEFVETLHEVVECFRSRVEESGDGEAALVLGIAYRDGCGVEQKDSGKAVKWLREASLRGRARAYHELVEMKGDCVHLSEEIDDALKDMMKYFRWRAEESGDGEAALALGLAYRCGYGVEKRNLEEAEKWFRKATQRGHARAYRELGSMYGEDTNEKKDVARAAEYLQWAVQRGDALAYFNLVELGHTLDKMSHGNPAKGDEDEEANHDLTVHVSEALKRAVESLQRQVEVRRDVVAEHALGRAYSEGRGVERDFDQARKWLEKAADQGDLEAQMELDSLEHEPYLYDGEYDATLGGYDEVPITHEEYGMLGRFFERIELARGGAPLKQYEFAKYLESPEGPGTVEDPWSSPHALKGVEKTELVALYWYQKAAEGGHAGAQYELGRAYFVNLGREEGADVAKAVCWYRKAAEQGHVEAQYELGWGYREGWGVEEDADVGQAACWFRKAAEQGHAGAQYELGCGYREGWGVEEDADVDQAACWFRKAAEQGHVEARYELGRGYLDGWGEERSADVSEAAKWLRWASEENHAQAQYELGCAYRDGRLGELGVEQRVARAEAGKWLRMAEEQGHPDAPDALARVRPDGHAEENE